MGLSIAVAGKGGTGKTTFASLLVRALREAGVTPILAVDADPNSNLADALGVECERTLSEIREESSSPEGSPASGVGRVRAIEDDIQRSIGEGEGFDIITMGRPEGPRCYCYVNTLLRKCLADLARNYAAVVIDNEAGMEHLSRRTTDNVDVLVSVMDPTLPAMRAAGRILDLSRQLPVRIARRALLVMRAAPQGLPQALAEAVAELEADRLPDVPQDDAVQQAGAAGRDVFSIGEDSSALARVKEILRTLRPGAGPTNG